MNKKLITSLVACFLILMLLFTGCKKDDSVKKTSNEEVTFFTEEVNIEKQIEQTKIYENEKDDVSFDKTFIYEEGGKEYEMVLDDVKIEPAKISGRTAELEYTYSYKGYFTRPTDIPEDIDVIYKDNQLLPPKEAVILTDTNGTVKEVSEDKDLKTIDNTYTLKLEGVTETEPYTESFTAPMLFENYGAAYYQLSDGVFIPHNDAAPIVKGYENALLNYLKLDRTYFSLQSASWNGDPYTNANGIYCRNAVVYGLRTVKDYEAKYIATVKLDDVSGYKATATYIWRGVQTNVRKVATVSLGGAAVVGGGIFVPVVFFRHRKKKENDEE